MIHGVTNLCLGSTIDNMNASVLDAYVSEPLRSRERFWMSEVYKNDEKLAEIMSPNANHTDIVNALGYENILNDLDLLTNEFAAVYCDTCILMKGIQYNVKNDFLLSRCDGCGVTIGLGLEPNVQIPNVPPRMNVPNFTPNIPSQTVAPGASVLLKSRYNPNNVGQSPMLGSCSSSGLEGVTDGIWKLVNPADVISIKQEVHGGFSDFSIQEALKYITTDQGTVNKTLNEINSTTNVKEEQLSDTYMDLEEAISHVDFTKDNYFDILKLYSDVKQEASEEEEDDDDDEDDDDENDDDDDENDNDYKNDDDEEDEDEDEEEEEEEEEMEMEIEMEVEEDSKPKVHHQQTSYDVSQIGPINDHCYTMRTGMDVMGVQTPSDSEEDFEIDVVGDGTATRELKEKLPTNPSPNSRQELELKIKSTVAEKIKPSRVVKQPGGLRTLPPRRSIQEPEIKKPAPSKPKKAAPSPRKRKRDDDDDDDDEEVVFKAPKKPRKKRTKKSETEIDIDERRNLHNNMERQRRVGLRHLFNLLKNEIPDLKYKERAPKVMILQRATLLCKAFQAMELEHEKTVARREVLKTKLSKLRNNLYGDKYRYMYAKCARRNSYSSDSQDSQRSRSSCSSRSPSSSRSPKSYRR